MFVFACKFVFVYLFVYVNSICVLHKCIVYGFMYVYYKCVHTYIVYMLYMYILNLYDIYVIYVYHLL